MSEESKKEDHGQILMSWSFPEYAKYRRSVGWYVGMVIVVGSLLLYCVLTANFLFAVIVVMMLMVVVFHNLREPVRVDFYITEDGLKVGERFYAWSDIKNFWIIYQPPEVKTLYFDFKGLAPNLPVDLQDQNPIKVREVLLRFLKEDLTRERELAGDELSRWLKI